MSRLQSRSCGFWLFLSGILLLFAFEACSAQRARIESKGFSARATREFLPLTINDVVVMPLEANETLTLEPAVLSQADGMLVRALNLGTSMEIRNQSQPKQVEKALAAPEMRQAIPLQERAELLGKALGVQGVYFGTLDQYKDSDGSRLGASQPASVRFHVSLLSVKTGQVVWRGVFQRTEAPATSNLLVAGENFSDGVSFRSANELLHEGFRLLANDMEERRSQPIDSYGAT